MLPAGPGWGRSELLVTLRSIRDDYVLDRSDARTITAALAADPDLPEIQDAELSTAELAAAVTAVLRVVVAYDDALDA